MEEKKGIRRIRNRKYIQSTLKERTFPSAERNSVKKKKREENLEKKFYLAKKCAWIKAHYKVFDRIGRKLSRVGRQKT